MWAPEHARIRDKIKITMYSLEAQKILSASGFHVAMQANDFDDVDTSIILDKIRQTSRVF